MRFTDLPILIGLLCISACGLHPAPERIANKRKTPSDPAPAPTSTPVSRIDRCQARGPTGQEFYFRYPNSGEVSVFEAPTQTVRFEFRAGGDELVVTIDGRQSTADPYLKQPFPFRYALQTPVSIGYAWKVEIGGPSPGATDEWVVTCAP